MKAEFTPGPWITFTHNNSFGVQMGEDGGFLMNQFMNRAKENAQIISAAPEMYKALNDLLNDCINFGGDNLSDCYLKSAALALAKARGET